MKKNVYFLKHPIDFRDFVKVRQILLRLLTLLFLLSLLAEPTLGNSIRINIGSENVMKLFHETMEISGTVRDGDGSPLVGATIVEKGTNNGTQTDVDGKFSLRISDEDAVLVVTYIGFASKEIEVKGQTILNINMEERIVNLDEVVVVGYGTVKKSDLTGSVSSIKGDELRSYPAYNATQALKGKATGVEIRQNSGNPSSRIEVRIRGANSMIGSNDPLYVVDGVPLLGGIEFLNPGDIQTMDILKDASATAIYGSRGANGVIIITTKGGQKGSKNRISVDSYYGIQKDVKRYDVLDAGQYAIVVNEWLKNEGQSPYFDLNEIQGSGTDWQDAIFRAAPVQNHTISFSGSHEKTTYFLSGNFYSQNGIIKNTSAKRGSIKLSLNHQLNKAINVAENIILTRRETYSSPVDNGAYGKTTLSGALSAPPTLPLYDEDGLPTAIERAYFFGSVDMRNPLIFLEPRKDRDLTNKILTNTTLSIDLLTGLTFRSLVGIEYSFAINDNFQPVIFPTDQGFASDGYNYQNSFVNENTLNYKRDFGKDHSLNIIGGFTLQNFKERGLSVGVNGLATNITENHNLSGASIINTPSNYYSEWKLLSWLGRANYTFKNKYLFTASVRTDGSSRFGANHKWGLFPSGAVGWIVSNEPFMENVAPINQLKLRASYGVTGNTALSPYQSLSRLNSTKYIVSGGSQQVGWVPTGIGNPDLKWETTDQLDIGFDLGLFESRFLITADYYKKVTSNLLATIPLPPSLGFGSTLKNFGKIQNQGIELSIDASIYDKTFKWNIVGNISGNRNKVLELSQGSDIESGSLDIPFYSATNIIREQQPFGMFYGYQEDGLDENGLIKYIDNNQDGVISAEDRVIIGNPYPDFIFSISNNFSYKNFDLSIFIDGSQGNDIFWATAGTQLNSFQRGQNQLVDLIGNYWTAEDPNPNAKYPKLSSSSAFTVSDRFIFSGSYVRVRSLTLGYSIPTENISWCTKARLYVSGTNLFTFTNYPGLDPESNTVGTDDQNAASRSRIGIDQGAYPSARTISLGLNLSF